MPGVTQLWSVRPELDPARRCVPRSFFGGKLLSTDLYEGRHASGIHSETVGYEVVVGAQIPQTQSDPIGPRQVIKMKRLHQLRVPESGLWTLSTRY